MSSLLGYVAMSMPAWYLLATIFNSEGTFGQNITAAICATWLSIVFKGVEYGMLQGIARLSDEGQDIE